MSDYSFICLTIYTIDYSFICLTIYTHFYLSDYLYSLLFV